MSAVLQALTSINSVPFNLTNPNVHPTSDPDATEVPVTSLPCKWKAPKSENRVQCECQKQYLRNTTITSR